MAHRACTVFDELNAQDVCNLAWALAKLQLRDEALQQKLVARARWISYELNAQEVSNLA